MANRNAAGFGNARCHWPERSIFANRDGLDLASRGNRIPGRLSYHECGISKCVLIEDLEIFIGMVPFELDRASKIFVVTVCHSQSISRGLIDSRQIRIFPLARGFAQIRIALCMGKQSHAVEILEVIRWQLSRTVGQRQRICFGGQSDGLKKSSELAQIIPPLGALVIIQHTPHTPPQTPNFNNGLHCLHFHRLRRGPQGVQGPGACRSLALPLAPVLPPVAL